MIKLLKQLLDWIYPKQCYFCRKNSDSLMCPACFEKLELLTFHPVKTVKNVNIYTIGLYENNLKKLIKAVKYHNKTELIHHAALLLNKLMQNFESNNTAYEIIPVPLHSKRQKQRGFNHMFLIAKELSVLTGCQVNNDLIERIKETKPQYTLTKEERQQNLAGAFKVNANNYNRKPLLIIDDICTTGATIEEMLNELEKYNITNVEVLVLAVPNFAIKPI